MPGPNTRKDQTRKKKTEVADVCLLMEGSYPYVSGGVSTWTHKLIQSYPEWTFSILHLSPTAETFDSPKYSVPENVLHVRDEYLFEEKRNPEKKLSETDITSHEVDPARVYRKLYNRDWDILESLTPRLRSGEITRDEILNDAESYRVVEELYREKDLSVSFLQYFWNTRFLVSPLLRLLSFDLPEAKLYHAVSAGYGGFLGVLVRLISDRPFLLTEHGIYLRERKIELSRSKWVREQNQTDFYISERQEFFEKEWESFFEDVTKLIYRYATGIVTISRRNQKHQKEMGASPSKMKLVPNGVDLSTFDQKNNRPPAGADDEFRIAFIGRVVPVKDIRTYLQAVKLLTYRDVPFHAFVTGETEEDPEYYDECRDLRNMLDLEPVLDFTGSKAIPPFFDEVDLVVLTSIKEAQPLIIIEANCSGIPVVATRVGSCPELLRGRPGADRRIGRSGLLTDIASPQETADAIERLYRDRSLYETLSENGRERVRSFYAWQDVRDEYERIYQSYRSEEPWQELGSI